MNRFIQIARGSVSELEYHLLLARDRRFVSVDDFEELEAKVFENPTDGGLIVATLEEWGFS